MTLKKANAGAFPFRLEAEAKGWFQFQGFTPLPLAFVFTDEGDAQRAVMLGFERAWQIARVEGRLLARRHWVTRNAAIREAAALGYEVV